MSMLAARAQRYRERAGQLIAQAEQFHDPENRKTLKILAEEYMTMARRLERVPSLAAPEAGSK